IRARPPCASPTRGALAEAVSVLERRVAASRGESDAYDLFFLAMAHHRLGQMVPARAGFDRALRWVLPHPPHAPERARGPGAFRAEAAAVLAGLLVSFRPACSRRTPGPGAPGCPGASKTGRPSSPARRGVVIRPLVRPSGVSGWPRTAWHGEGSTG